MKIECERCGNTQQVERTGRFRDGDYYELFHDFMDLEIAYKELRRDYRRMEMKWSEAEFMRGIENTIAEGWRTLYECQEYADQPRKSKFDTVD